MRYRRLRLAGGTYFFTVVTFDRQPLFRLEVNSGLLEVVIDRVRARHPFEIEAQVILPDHLHAIWTLPEGDSDFPTRWMLIKSAFSRELGKRSSGPTMPHPTGRGRAVWQGRYWEHAIRDQRDFNAHVDYVHFNPVHHGLVADPLDWRHSTFRRHLEAGIYSAGWGLERAPEIPEGVGRE